MNNKSKINEHSFYMKVYGYIYCEYKPKYAKSYADSDLSENIASIVVKHFRLGDTVPFVAGKIVNMIKNQK